MATWMELENIVLNEVSQAQKENTTRHYLNVQTKKVDFIELE
jgi:hypothetical protein